MALWQQQLTKIIAPAVERSLAIQEILIGKNTLQRVADVITRVTPHRKVLLMSDSAGFGAAGQPVLNTLQHAGFVTSSIILPNNPLPKADINSAEPFRKALAAETKLFPISIGSGVINDLVKWAAFQCDRNYLTVATAASMDGFTSAGAPLAKDGFKITIPTRAPIAMVADLDVIANAPAKMNGWGYGDLAGKISAFGDWMLADAVGVEPIDEDAWNLVQRNLLSWLANPRGIARGHTDSIAQLFIGLTTVGLAMEFYGSSRPASGADHQIAHMWEMEELKYNERKINHGAAVGVGCVVTLTLFDWLKEQDFCNLDVKTVVSNSPNLEARIQHLREVISDEKIASKAEQELIEKNIHPELHRQRLEQFLAAWPTLQSRLFKYLKCAEEVANMLLQAGCPAYPKQIGVSRDHLLQTLHAASYIRRRYTIFDLLHELGLTESAFASVLTKLRFTTNDSQ